MITYQGDKFVKGKKFILNNSEVKFITKTNKGYIFESSKGVTLKIDRERAQKLKESYEPKFK